MEQSKRFRNLLRRYPTGVTIVTMRDGEVDHGMTANSVTSLSADPPRMLVCVARTTRAHTHLPAAGHFVVNLLAHDQRDVSAAFADDDLSDEQRWATVTTHRGELGALRIDGCMGYLECILSGTFAGGSHDIYVGDVVAMEEGVDTAPLVFWDGAYTRLAP